MLVTFIITGSFILFDVITGILKALYTEGLNSTLLRKGLFHKLSEVLAVAVSAFLEYGGQYIHFNIDLPILSIVTAYICIMELISVIENLCVLNPSLNKLFQPYLEKLKEENDGDKEKRN